MKAYSLDLRQKIVDAYAEGNFSQRQVAKQFFEAFEQVSLKDICNWFTHCCYCTSLD